MGYYIKFDNKFVSDRHKLRDSKSYARYLHHPSDCRLTITAMETKGLVGKFQVFAWQSDEDVTEYVLSGARPALKSPHWR
jgi:hypothetical protein